MFCQYNFFLLGLREAKMVLVQQHQPSFWACYVLLFFFLTWLTVSSVDHCLLLLSSVSDLPRKNNNILEHFKKYLCYRQNGRLMPLKSTRWYGEMIFHFWHVFYRPVRVLLYVYVCCMCLNAELFSFLFELLYPSVFVKPFHFCHSKVLPNQYSVECESRKKSIEYVYIITMCVQWVANKNPSIMQM